MQLYDVRVPLRSSKSLPRSFPAWLECQSASDGTNAAPVVVGSVVPGTYCLNAFCVLDGDVAQARIASLVPNGSFSAKTCGVTHGQSTLTGESLFDTRNYSKANFVRSTRDVGSVNVRDYRVFEDSSWLASYIEASLVTCLLNSQGSSVSQLPPIGTEVVGMTTATIDLGYYRAVLHPNDRLGALSDAPELRFVDRIEALRNLKPNWNRRGGLVPTNDAIDDAKTIYRSLPSGIPEPELEPSGDGEINFVWRRPRAYLELGVYGDGQASFYGKIGDKEYLGDIDEILNQLPETLELALEAFSHGDM